MASRRFFENFILYEKELGIFFQRVEVKFNMALVNEAFKDYLQFENQRNQTGMIMDGIKI